MASTYGQFCRSRWRQRSSVHAGTVLVVRELLCGSIGSTISAADSAHVPSLLSKRLMELEQLGVVEVMATSHPVFMNTT